MVMIIAISLTRLGVISQGVVSTLLISFFSVISKPAATPHASGLNPIIIAALIGVGGVIIGALIGGAFALNQSRRNAQLQKEVIRYQKAFDEESQRKEREREGQEAEKQAAQSEMQRARTLEQRVEAYRKALHADPRIARLQILDMNRPLDVTDIYIRVQLHQEKSGYDLDPLMQEAASGHDPNALLKARQRLLETRASKAFAPEDAIRTNKHCVIVGDPGAGKTTLLKYLALQSVDGKLPDLPDLPIHIELNAFANSGHRDLLEFAASVWKERYGFPKDAALSYMEEQLQQGNAILLLDALDETVAGTTKEQAEESYNSACKTIIDTGTRYPLAPIAVTARKAGYHQRVKLAGFTELEVLDFRAEDIKQFVERWFACHPDLQKQSNAQDLNAKLERNARLETLAANPLLLSLIVIVYEEQLDLPSRRAELYKQCVDILLTKWDASRNIRRRREFNPEHKRQLLTEIAWHFHRQGQRYFPERELLDTIASFLPAIGLSEGENGQVLNEIAAENGLLKEQAHGWYGFLHLTLQEYFVAQYAVDHQQELDTLLEKRDDPWWEEVILLYTGRVSDASPLLQCLLGRTQVSLRDDLFHTNLILAGRCLAAYPTIRQVLLRECIVSQLFQLLTTSRYALEQQRCAEALAEIASRDLNEQLVALLSDEQLNRGMRDRIAEALGMLGERSIAPQLMQLIDDERLDVWVRMGIANALGELGERLVVPQLMRLLSSESVDISVRTAIAPVVGLLGEKSVVSQLLTLSNNLLEEGSFNNSILISSIIGAISSLQEKSAIPQLVALLLNDHAYEQIRWTAADALEQLGEGWAIPNLAILLSNKQLDEPIVLELAALLSKEQLREPSVVSHLAALLSNKYLNRVVRLRIAGALGQSGDRSIAPQLVSLLSDEQLDWTLRTFIADSLGQLGEQSVVPHLVNLLSNKYLNTDVCESIAEALGQLGNRSVASQMIEMIVDEDLDKNVRKSIANALTTLINDVQQVRTLASMFFTSDIPDSIYSALWTLSRKVGVRIYVVGDSDSRHLLVEKHSPTRSEV
jgi:HEAT repeat protein/GTPase SAR1 family protein